MSRRSPPRPQTVDCLKFKKLITRNVSTMKSVFKNKPVNGESRPHDMFDVNIDREDQKRMLFEREVYGRDAMNVIACEGFARVERPETYKQWQMRNLRARFRQIPLDKDIFSRVKNTVRSEYHGDFIIDQDGHWMLQGWKGRVIYALSCWVPV